LGHPLYIRDGVHFVFDILPGVFKSFLDFLLALKATVSKPERRIVGNERSDSGEITTVRRALVGFQKYLKLSLQFELVINGNRFAFFDVAQSNISFGRWQCTGVSL